MTSDMFRHRYRLSALTAEFASGRVEQVYRARVAPATARYARLAVITAALFFLAFGVTDYVSLGLGRSFYFLLALRGLVLVTGLVVVIRLKASPLSVMTGRAVTLVETVGFAVFFAIALLRPAELPIHGMSMTVMVIAVYLFLPNRVVLAAATGVAASIGFLLVAVEYLPPDIPSLVVIASMLLLINCFGLMAAYRLSVVRREEYALLAGAEAANRRLSHEVAERRRLQDELQRLATTDGLTGLWTRRHYLSLSERERKRAQRTGKPVAILLLDVDHFKRVNDTHGHAAGDLALKRLAGTSLAVLRETDIVGRFGGEEFAITLPETGADLAGEIAERLRRDLEGMEIPSSRGGVRLTVSIGAALYRGGSETMEQILSRADHALYAAKRMGRNRVVFDAGRGSERNALA